jgi:hypothetical protein
VTTPYVLKTSRYTTAADLQKAVSTLYHVGFDNGTVFYGYNLVPDIAQSGGWHEKTDIAAKDAQIQYASPNIIDRDFVFWPRVTQGDWSGGGNQITFIAPNQYWDSDLDTRVPGYLTLRSRMQRTLLGANTSAFASGQNLQQVVPFNGDFYFSFCEASTIYNTHTGFVTNGTRQPVILDTDGNNLFVGNQVDHVDVYNTSNAFVNSVFTALAGGLATFNQMWVIDHGTFGHFLYYGLQGSNQALWKVDLSLGRPVAIGSHVQIPTDNLSEVIQDIAPYQTGLAILTNSAWNDNWSVWYHDGANMTPIVRMHGYFAAGMCTCMGDLFVGTYPAQGFASPVLWRISSGSISAVVSPGPPVPSAIHQGCLQPRTGGQRIYWPITNLNQQFAANAETVMVFDAITGATSRLPLTDAADLQIAGFASFDKLYTLQFLRRFAIQGDAIGFTNSTGTGPSSYSLYQQYQVANSVVPIQTPLYQTAGKIITSRIDFQTPGVEKRFRRFEAQHAPLPAGCGVRLDAFIDKDPAAYTAALTPDATLSNAVAGTVSTELFLNNLIAHTIYFVITLTSADGGSSPIINYYFVESTTPWSWEMLLDCTAIRRLLNGETDDPQGATGKDLAYLFRNAWENPSKLTMYHRNGNTYTVAIESLDLWNPSPMTQSQPQARRDEEYQVKITLRQTL